MTQRDSISELIHIYLNGITSISQDAGWRGDSLMSKVIEFGGDIPRGSGNDLSNMSMISAIKLLREEHHDLKKIRAVIAELMCDYKHREGMISLLARHYYVGICEITGKAYTDSDRMREIQQGPTESPEDPDESVIIWSRAESRFRSRIKTCYKKLSDEMAKYDRYMELDTVTQLQ